MSFALPVVLSCFDDLNNIFHGDVVDPWVVDVLFRCYTEQRRKPARPGGLANGIRNQRTTVVSMDLFLGWLRPWARFVMHQFPVFPARFLTPAPGEPLYLHTHNFLLAGLLEAPPAIPASGQGAAYLVTHWHLRIQITQARCRWARLSLQRKPLTMHSALGLASRSRSLWCLPDKSMLCPTTVCIAVT